MTDRISVTYLIMTASAKMPSSCRGNYRRVAVVELDSPDAKPKMISDRALGIKRIVKTWEGCNVGTSPRCAYRKALAEAEELVAKMERHPPHAQCNLTGV